MEAKVTWKHGFSFDGTAGSGFHVGLGARTETGEPAEGLSPMELILVGLAGCTGMDVISILLKKRQPVQGFEVKVSGERASDHPKVYTEIEVEYVVQGKGVEREAVERAVELSETKYCSVSAMLRKTAIIHNKITLVE
jgi:putative redox protein